MFDVCVFVFCLFVFVFFLICAKTNFVDFEEFCGLMIFVWND